MASNPKDIFYLEQPEPHKGCLLALRTLILSADDWVLEEWKYGLPFFSYKGKLFCYLWLHKKYKQPYIGFVEGHRMNNSALLQEKRVRMKILVVASDKNLPVRTIRRLVKEALSFYKSGIIPIK